MAQRLLLRRVWTLSSKDLRPLPVCSATTSSSTFPSSSLHTSSSPLLLAPLSFRAPARLLHHMPRPLHHTPRPLHHTPRPLHHAPRRSISSFNVQDHDDFTERVINSQLPVLVDFHAQWCGPCKILGPRLEKAVAKQKGRIAIAKVDIDDHTDLAIEYGVSAVPTVIAMRGGDIIDQFVGIKDDDQLDSFVSKLIGQ